MNPEDNTSEAREPTPTLVVGVGASAGGLEAFRSLVSVLPADAGLTFLLVQHLDPTHDSLLGELLEPHTDLEVVSAEEGASLRPNTIYIIQPDTALAVRDGKISLSTPTLHRGVRLPVDHLFRSLASEYGSRAAAVVLSGSGSDGASGIRDVNAAGGLVIAQQPDDAGQASMPQSAIDTGVVDLVLGTEQMPDALLRFLAVAPAQPPRQLEASGDEDPSVASSHFQQLAVILEARHDFNLRVYKTGTVERRLNRRMVLSDHESIDEYLEHLREDPDEQQALMRDLLINVTDFFRDEDAFAALRKEVIKPLVARTPAEGAVRIWVAGCATGEEAYSIAMEVLDEAHLQSKEVDLRVFATDIDSEALAVARAGIYPPTIAERVSARRLAAYFEPLGERGYKARWVLRDVLSFAVHDLTKDPPFSRMDLVTCRNVLIYLTVEAQRHVLAVHHFALHAKGHLFLGTSESTGPQRELYATVAKNARIYQKVGVSRLLGSARVPRARALGAEPDRPGKAEPTPDDRARRAVLQAWVAPTIVVSADTAITFMHGDLAPYLQFPQGDDPQLELGAMLRPELGTRTRGAIYRCRRSGETVVATAHSESGETIRVTAKRAESLGEDAVMVTFETVPSVPGSAPVESEEKASDAIVAQLEKELTATREDLRNTVEELETSNEELRSSNEESMSMNEELQSANEELEATSEELRSLNEELTTLNVQLREKIQQVEHTHDDLSNFFISANVAVVFLDERLRIKRFTPAAAELLDLDAVDEGRHVSDFARDLFHGDLEAEASEVLEHLSMRSRELKTSDGRWVSREVRPYRTQARRIEGVVVTFSDVTALKVATERLVLRERQQAVVAQMGLQALRELDLQNFLEQVVRDVQQTLDSDLCKILELQPGGDVLLLRAGVGWDRGLVGSGVVGTGPDSQAGYTLHSAGPVVVLDLPKEKRFSGPALLTDHHVVSGISCMIRDGEHDYGVLGVHTRTRREFTPEDTNFLQSVASIVGGAVGRSQARRRMALERSVAQVLSEVRDLDRTMDRIFELLVTEMEAAVCELWWANSEADGLVCRKVHVVREFDRRKTLARFGRETMGSREGMPGRSFSERRAIWSTDRGSPLLFERREAAEEVGLQSGFAFPICVGNQTLGVITGYSAGQLALDEASLRSLEAVGRAIGDFHTRLELEQRAKGLAALTESSHDAIITYDPEGIILEWLAGAELLFGYSANEMEGESVVRIIPDDTRPALRRVHDRIRRGEIVEPFETQRRCRDGSFAEVSVRVAAIRNAEGEIVAFSSTERDVSRLKSTQMKLVQADQQKDEFLAMLGHELRNPLAAIRSASELLKMLCGDDARLIRTQTVLERQTTHMAKLIDGLLDVSRIIRGKITLDPKTVDFVTVCRDVVIDAEERIHGRDLTMRVHLPDAPVWVSADRVRLAQVVDNLLSNASKYTADGGTVTLQLTSAGGMAQLEVQDTGVGIEPTLLPHVFEVFRQSEQTLDRSSGGLGLGLALVKGLVELQGGEVAARSPGRGEGATFSVLLPLTEAPSSEEPPEDASRPQPARILLIEDNEDAAEMLRQVLEVAGHTVSVASRGKLGLELARAERPDIVFCDIGLPDGMTGYDVAQTFQSDESLRGIPIIALSGYGRPEDRARGEERGFHEHLTKPVDSETLLRVIDRLQRFR